MAIYFGDRLLQVRTADEKQPVVRCQRASATGDRFILARTADGAQVPVKVLPVTRTYQRGIAARTADGVDVLVEHYPIVDAYMPNYSAEAMALYDATGQLLDIRTNMDGPYYVAANPSRGYCTAGLIGSGWVINRYDAHHNLMWTYDGHTESILQVPIDANGSVYSASIDNPVRKIDSAGTLTWSYTGHSDTVRCVAVDADGNVYSGSNDKTVHKINNSGTKLWEFVPLDVNNDPVEVYGVAPDGAGNVYVGGRDRYVNKVAASDGALIWRAYVASAFGGGAIRVDTDQFGNVYATGSNRCKKFDSTGTELWEYVRADGQGIYRPAVSPDGYVYFPTNDDYLVQLNTADGTVNWEKAPLNFSVTVDVACLPGKYGAFPAAWAS